jgi:hypothetical protein
MDGLPARKLKLRFGEGRPGEQPGHDIEGSDCGAEHVLTA